MMWSSKKKLFAKKKTLESRKSRLKKPTKKNSSLQQATSQKIGIFWYILKTWRGSVYKLLYADLLLYLTFYYLIIVIYKFGLNDAQKPYFEDIVKYCRNYSTFFPISFVLGFFVSTIMNRWWNQFCCIPRPTGLAVLLSASLQGNDEIGKALRRTIMRYVNCSITMVLRQLSIAIKRRFPTNQHLVDAGLLNKNEYKILNDINENYPGNSNYALPIIWAATIVTKARDIGRIKNDYACKALIEELNKIRGQGGTLISYITVNISLVYIQVVTIACYSYFVAALFGSQSISPKYDVPQFENGTAIPPAVLSFFESLNMASKAKADKFQVIDFNYFPIFLILQFVFYMGWLKVAEENINPFGEDDDDFDVSSMIDSNLQMSFLIVDKMFDQHPIILKDTYWGDAPSELKDVAPPDTPEDTEPPTPLDNVIVNDENPGSEGFVNKGITVEEAEQIAQSEIAADILPALIEEMPENLKGIIRVDTLDQIDMSENIESLNSEPPKPLQFEEELENFNETKDYTSTLSENSNFGTMSTTTTNDIAPLVNEKEDSKL